MLPTVGGIVTSPCSAENRSQAQISNSLCFLCKMSVQEVNFTDACGRPIFAYFLRGDLSCVDLFDKISAT